MFMRKRHETRAQLKKLYANVRIDLSSSTLLPYCFILMEHLTLQVRT